MPSSPTRDRTRGAGEPAPRKANAAGTDPDTWTHPATQAHINTRLSACKRFFSKKVPIFVMPTGKGGQRPTSSAGIKHPQRARAMPPPRCTPGIRRPRARFHAAPWTCCRDLAPLRSARKWPFARSFGIEAGQRTRFSRGKAVGPSDTRTNQLVFWSRSSRICSSRSCFGMTSEGAPISKSSARWVIGKSATSRKLCSRQSSITMRSSPAAMPP